MVKRRFYVCYGWHDYPEGGTYATTVMAEDRDHAEALCKAEMAASYAESIYEDDEPATCPNCCNTDQDGSDLCVDCGNPMTPGVSAVEKVLNDYGTRWDLIDCYPIEDSPDGQILAAIIKAWDEPHYGFPETQLDNLIPHIQAARERLYGALEQ